MAKKPIEMSEVDIFKMLAGRYQQDLPALLTPNMMPEEGEVVVVEGGGVETLLRPKEPPVVGSRGYVEERMLRADLRAPLRKAAKIAKRKAVEEIRGAKNRLKLKTN